MSNSRAMGSRAGVTALTADDIEQFGDQVTGGWGTGVLEGYLLGTVTGFAAGAVAAASLDIIAAVVVGTIGLYTAAGAVRIINNWALRYPANTRQRNFYFEMSADISNGVTIAVLRERIRTGFYGDPR